MRLRLRDLAGLPALAVWTAMVAPFYLYHYVKQRAWELPR